MFALVNVGIGLLSLSHGRRWCLQLVKVWSILALKLLYKAGIGTSSFFVFYSDDTLCI